MLGRSLDPAIPEQAGEVTRIKKNLPLLRKVGKKVLSELVEHIAGKLLNTTRVVFQ